MPELTLAYRCCDRKLPRYIKHSEVEGIAVLARQQLVDANTDAISLSVDCASAVASWTTPVVCASCRLISAIECESSLAAMTAVSTFVEAS